jgi:putative transposase
MSEDKVVALRQEGEIDDPLTEILRTGAKRLIEQAVEAEFAAFLTSHGDLKLPDGRQRVVRHGHDPVRSSPQRRRDFRRNTGRMSDQHPRTARSRRL